MLSSFSQVVFTATAILCAETVKADHHGPLKAPTASLVRTLGYGGAIHNFKNYVLRGEAEPGEAAERIFQQAREVLAELNRVEGLTANEKNALETIGGIVKQYQAHLPTVGQLHREGKSVEAIDESVTVDDSAAINAIAVLRGGHEWNEIENLDFHIGYGSGIHNFKNFVLRADEKYRARASAGLSKVLLILARYRGTDGLSDSQLKALDDIDSVVRHYERALAEVQVLIGEGKTASEIDAVVKVDDSPALRGLETLRESSGGVSHR